MRHSAQKGAAPRAAILSRATFTPRGLGSVSGGHSRSRGARAGRGRPSDSKGSGAQVPLRSGSFAGHPRLVRGGRHHEHHYRADPVPAWRRRQRLPPRRGRDHVGADRAERDAHAGEEEAPLAQVGRDWHRRPAGPVGGHERARRRQHHRGRSRRRWRRGRGLGRRHRRDGRRRGRDCSNR